MFPGKTYNKQRDVVAITIEALGAQIGGVLSLWLGLGLSVCFEILEFLVTLVARMFSDKTRNKGANRSIF